MASWDDLGKFINRFDYPNWEGWKHLADRFMNHCIERQFNRYFRAGQSMTTLVFSTLDHHGLQDEPRVNVVLHPPDKLELSYYPGLPVRGADNELEYELNFETGVATFQRFLNHLWEMTMPEPLPADLRGFTAPVLTDQNNEEA